MGEPITDLRTLLTSMSPALDPRVFAFTTVTEDAIASVAPYATMLFREPEALTAIVERNAAQGLGLDATFSCRMITLHVHSALEAVGFLAALLPRLAADRMGVNPVSAFHHDHLFVPEDRAEDALSASRDIAATARLDGAQA